MNPIVGVYSDSYPDQRMILNKVPELQYIQIENRRENIGRVLRFAGRCFPAIRQTELYAQGVHFTLDAPPYPEIDVIHTFNRVCLHDRNRWMATFEKTFPEYFSEETKINLRLIKKQLPLILSDQCTAILPMSEWAYRYELWLLSQFAKPEEIDRIKNKMTVLYPPQEILITEEEIRNKFSDTSRLRFLYVGGQVKRKGGAEILKAFARLRQRYDVFSLVFIGKTDDSYGNFYLDKDEKKIIQDIIAHADWLEYHEKLSNEEVLRFAKQAHVGLLPTMGDTFGFSVLEMQACGCPVITTDRQALPEINNDQCGWLINTKDIQLSHGDDFAHYTRKEVELLSGTIVEQLMEHVSRIIENRKLLYNKAVRAVERIGRYHAPECYKEKMKTLYLHAAEQPKSHECHICEAVDCEFNSELDIRR